MGKSAGSKAKREAERASGEVPPLERASGKRPVPARALTEPVPNVRVGIGGWNFAPWRDNFYPKGLPQKQELQFASSRLGSIEINSTYYGSQKPASFARWRDETPPGFVFSVKGPRYVGNRRVLAEAGPSIERFFASGVMELGDKLGPVNWQLLPTKQFEPADFAAFLELLPSEVDGRALRHAVEVRHPSFETQELVELLRCKNVALVFTDKKGVPQLHDLTAPFVYLRLQGSAEKNRTGYTANALATWVARIERWAQGKAPEDLPTLVESEAHPASSGREVFVYLINGFKPRAPAAAMALIERLGGLPASADAAAGRS